MEALEPTSGFGSQERSSTPCVALDVPVGYVKPDLCCWRAEYESGSGLKAPGPKPEGNCKPATGVTNDAGFMADIQIRVL